MTSHMSAGCTSGVEPAIRIEERTNVPAQVFSQVHANCHRKATGIIPGNRAFMRGQSDDNHQGQEESDPEYSVCGTHATPQRRTSMDKPKPCV